MSASGTYRLFLLAIPRGVDPAVLENYLEKTLGVADPIARKRILHDLPAPLIEHADESLVTAIGQELAALGAKVEIKKIVPRPPPQSARPPQPAAATTTTQPIPKSDDTAGFVVYDNPHKNTIRLLGLAAAAALAGVIFAVIAIRLKPVDKPQAEPVEVASPESAADSVVVSISQPNSSDADLNIPPPSTFEGEIEDGSANIERVNELVAQGNFTEAIKILETMKADGEGAPELDKFLARLYISQAIINSKTDGDLTAEEYLRKAIDLLPDEPAAYEQLGGYYYANKDNSRAHEYLELAVERGSKNAFVYAILAMIYYQHKNDMDKAVERMETAVSLEPENEEFSRLLNKIKTERAAESDFMETGGSRFTVKYEGIADDTAANMVLYELERAYGAVGYDLGEYPPDPLGVVLYTNSKFSEITKAPHWAGGVFDGRIKLPTGGIGDADMDNVRRLVYHEYTHAVIYRITNGNCPVWLNEGLAMLMQDKSGSSDPWIKIDTLRKYQPLPLADLSAPFLKLNETEALVAYTESYYAVVFFNEQYGLSGARALLAELGKGLQLPEAFPKAVGTELPDFERRFNTYIQSEAR